MDIIWKRPEIIQHSKNLINSYEKYSGNNLIAPQISEMDLARQLYEAPFVLVSHNLEEDPIFNYSNKQAQELWELDWDKFTSMPSRLSAETIERTARREMLNEAQKLGIIKNYNGIRISSKGQKFIIKEAILWNVEDEKGNFLGQAATFSKWEFMK